MQRHKDLDSPMRVVNTATHGSRNSRSLLGFNPNRGRLLRWVVFVFPLVIISCLALTKTLSGSSKEGLYSTIVLKEGGPVENATSLAYILAFLSALLIAIRFFRMRTRRNLLGFLYLLLSLAFLFVGMEEISWGQRILDIQPSAFFKEHNSQKEYTLHNLETIAPNPGEGRNYVHKLYTIVGFVGAFAWLGFHTKMKNNASATVHYFVPSWYLALYFLPVTILYLYVDLSRYYLDGGYAIAAITSSDQEPAEMLLSFGFLLFAMINLYRQKSLKTA